VTPIRVFQLEHTLVEVASSKKKRRDLFRDFLGEIIESLKCQQISSGGGRLVDGNTADSIFHQEGGRVAAVMNIQARVMRPKLPSVLPAIHDDPDFSLTSLFDD
jgi:hypothetical protein